MGDFEFPWTEIPEVLYRFVRPKLLKHLTLFDKSTFDADGPAFFKMCIKIDEQQFNNTRAVNFPSYRSGGTSAATSAVTTTSSSRNKGVHVREAVGPKVVWVDINECEGNAIAHTRGDPRDSHKVSKVLSSDKAKSVGKEASVVSVNTLPRPLSSRRQVPPRKGRYQSA